MARLTKNRLEAITEAIGHRLAGPTDKTVSRKDLEAAQDWALEELRKRRRPVQADAGDKGLPPPQPDAIG